MIKFGDVRLAEEEITAALQVLRSGYLRSGKMVATVEEKLSSLTGAKHAILVSSGTSALHIALLFADVRGREVITSAYTFMATINAIVHAGAIPVLADIDLDATLSPQSVADAWTTETKLVLPVHMFGNAADLAAIQQCARGSSIIEDCAYAIGTRYNGIHVGTQHVGGCFSFGVLKPLTCGEGGAIITDDMNFDRFARGMRNYGFIRTDEPPIGYGLNYKIVEPSAALLSGQLDRATEILERKRSIHLQYYGRLGNRLRFLAHPSTKNSNFAFTVIELPDDIQSSMVVRQMRERQIEIQSIRPIHQIDGMRSFIRSGHLKRSEEFARRIVCLPSHLSLSDNDVDQVCDVLLSVIGSH